MLIAAFFSNSARNSVVIKKPLKKKKMVEYIHVHQQNVEYCPATYKMVEKMMERL